MLLHFVLPLAPGTFYMQLHAVCTLAIHSSMRGVQVTLHHAPTEYRGQSLFLLLLSNYTDSQVGGANRSLSGESEMSCRTQCMFLSGGMTV